MNMMYNTTSKKAQKIADFFNRHQIDIPLKITITIVIGYLLGVPFCEKFILISGKLLNGMYKKTLWDVAFLFFYFCIFTFLRAAVMDYILKPLSVKAKVSKKKVLRFAEQSWLVIYYSVSFSSGLYIFYHSPTWNNTSYFWRDYPVWELESCVKYYYLLQFAFWIQQPFVLLIEEPRKDYVEYILHHVNTLLLVSLSYGCNFTRVGIAVFVCMDLPDVLLCLAKTLHYLKYGLVCDLTFVVMVFSWLYTRVYFYGKIIWSTYTESELYVPKFALDPMNGNWFPHFVKYIILCLMLGLYILILFWTLMIFKVVFKLITKTGITDVRSDDEDSNDSNEGIANEKTKVDPRRKRSYSTTEQIRKYAARR